MPDFDVRYLQDGAVQRRRLQAADATGVIAALGVPPAQVLGVTPVGAPAAGRTGARRPFPLRLFSQELAVLLGAGIPLLEAVQTLREKEAHAAVAHTLAEVMQGLQAGQSFSAALSRCPQAFDTMYVAVVASAERTGQLQQALRAQADYLAWVDTLRSKLIGAAIYPALLIIAGGLVLLFLLVFVVPRFAGLIEGVGGDLPVASRWLLVVGGWTGAHPLLAVAMGLALLAAPAVLAQLPAVRQGLGELLWQLPSLGEKLRLLALARLYRTLSMLLGAGVPLVPALRTAQPVVAEPLRPALVAATEAVSRGERLSLVLERERLGTPVSVRMVRVGERSGAVGEMLGQAAAFYDEELTRLSELVTRLVNPVLMLVMGTLIGAVVVLMYLPIFQLMEQVQP